MPSKAASGWLELFSSHQPRDAIATILRRNTEGSEFCYGDQALAFVPVCARYPYEAWVAPIAPVASFADLDAPQIADLARALAVVLRKYDGLWQRPLPYLMAWYQAPTDGHAHPGAHLHQDIRAPGQKPQGPRRPRRNRGCIGKSCWGVVSHCASLPVVAVSCRRSPVTLLHPGRGCNGSLRPLRSAADHPARKPPIARHPGMRKPAPSIGTTRALL